MTNETRTAKLAWRAAWNEWTRLAGVYGSLRCFPVVNQRKITDEKWRFYQDARRAAKLTA